MVYPTPRTTAMTQKGLVLASENGDELIEYKEFVHFLNKFAVYDGISNDAALAVY